MLCFLKESKAGHNNCWFIFEKEIKFDKIFLSDKE